MGKIIAGSIKDFKAGTISKVTVDGREIAIANIDGTLHAFDDSCTHAGASLAEGRLEGCRVVCGWHGAVFDCTTGKLAKFPAKIRDLGSYSVHIKDQQVYIEVS